MPASSQLNTWIAESGSWQSYIDFKLPEDERAKYDFLPKYDNFYLSLMTRAIELLKADQNVLIEDHLATAKGLEIFSLLDKRNQFTGISQSDNVLYAAGLYYLANYPASAWILSKLYPKATYQSSIDQFITSFLRRDLSGSNEWTLVLKRFLETGRTRLLVMLRRSVILRKDESFNNDINEYFSHLLAEAILTKFVDDNIWADLLKVNDNPDHWRDYVIRNVEKKVPVWSFFPSQKLAIEKGILNGNTCSLQMPTSSGKTSISELVIYDEFKHNAECKILYLAPYRALASELKQTLAISLGQLGITSKTIYGGNLPTVEERTSITDVNLLISTPEKFMVIEDIFPGISQLFTTIICDEGHLLDDDSRGLSYELLLSRLKSQGDEVKRRFIFVSAIIPNISTVNAWLGGSDESLISSDYRPTELDYAFLLKMEKVVGYYLDVNPHKKRPNNYQLYKYLFGDELKIPITKKRSKNITSKKGISVAASLKATGSGTVALFAPHKRGDSGVEGLANEALQQVLSKDEGLLLKHSPDGFLKNLVEYFTIVFGEDYLLTSCAGIGVLFHHGDFPQNVREIVEDSLRDNKIRFVICTNTLAEGVNLPIKTIVLHSTKRYNPLALGNYSPLKIRDLKNLVGRAGRAGKETKGMVIIPHSEDFNRIRDLIEEKNVEPVKGQLYNIVKIITDYLRRRQLQISPEILDSLSEQLQELLDNVDTSLIDLLAEEVNPDELDGIVSELVKETLSYFQANDAEKETLSIIFGFRTNKIRPIIESGDFRLLKNSGTNIRLYEEIVGHFDFDDEIWLSDFKPLDKKWLKYILDDGVYKLPRFTANLETFNEENKCELKSEDIKKAIILWMSRSWYPEICDKLDLKMHQVLRLINSFVNFNIQLVVTGVIRLKELNSTNYALPLTIANWPAYLQHGVDTQLQLDLIEMGLVDRVAVIEVAEYLNEIGYEHIDYKVLKGFLLTSGTEIVESVKPKLPVISYNKLINFNNGLYVRNIL
jgi:helicase